MAEGGFFIGVVAARAGTNPKTIRYYETIGLLPNPRRGENRYRLYSQDVVELLAFIKKAQEFGFTLSEIKEIVALRRMGREPCVHVRALLERKISDLEQMLDDLVTLKENLKRLLARSQKREKRRRIKAVICPHIEGISPEPKRQG
ncbi:MAG: heavy metal-responsive transcriptional regulator [Candidatus Tectomicrobia bacterium]|uniref:Heavy metal-responsive transcriptional regulator n=1 Tax=Tectimicrobiota bacterium TaxID=2528274 RepID=A0A932GQU7_UNCTE|nr:heavy metal-responsive transcriptional regulator [Candidatus Tectomicrobia bacterium]